MDASGKTVVCIGTGPSLTLEQIEVARDKGFVLFGCNKVFEIVPDLAVLYAVNTAFWEHFWEQVEDHPAEKWTTNPDAARWFGLNLIGEVDRPGLSRDPSYVHHGHGSGATQVNLAYLMGAERILLLGYDLCYAPDYNGREQRIGSAPRHYFGEYPASMQHWPSVQVRDGVHVELLRHYQAMADQGYVEIINCTGGGALEAFPRARIEDV